MIQKGFHLFTGNRLEHLSKALTAVIRQPLADPFVPECVVVQSSGMARFISLTLADHLGVSANMDYLFPNAFIYKTLGLFANQTDDRNMFDPDILSWKISAVLPGLLSDPLFSPLSGYVQGESKHLKLYQLSCRIADTFDQYLLYRPDMISGWEKGHEQHWQAVLWRTITSGTDDIHRVRLISTFLDAVNTKNVPEGHFPQRVSVFGISALPKFHMDVFQAISEYVQVNLFLMNPCETYWGDILSVREQIREKRRSGNMVNDGLYDSDGNSLLASLGTVGRDFFDLVHTYPLIDYPLFEPPDENTLLSRIQSDMYHLRNAGSEQGEEALADPVDGSIECHSCHSPLREVEVLHDRLYRMFDDDPSLAPRDILVMTPDIETYAPFIQAVFNRKSDNKDQIPYSVADRGIKHESRIPGCFLSMLDLAQSRLTVSDILKILETDAVRMKFGIEETDLDVISTWISDTNIRWGKNSEHRKMMDLPGFEDNTWDAGLKRMLLGYAMPVKEKHLFSDILPYDPIEGGYAGLLGNFLRFIRNLFDWVESLREPASVKVWSDHLLEGVNAFFIEDDVNGGEVKMLRDEIRALSDYASYAGFSDKVDLSVIRCHLGKSLDQKGHDYGFITGGVTFCAMLPMRSIPFRKICLIGMNSDSYPRQNQPSGFDLMVKHPRPGDRSRRNDDRYLFLEALLSARESLYISYTGRNIRDNSVIQPSVIVSELLDYIEEAYAKEDADIREKLITEHPLQPFSSRYFEKTGDETGQRLFSYSRENYLAALAGNGPLVSCRDFIQSKLEPPGEEVCQVDIRDFCSFFRHPARYLLEKRLGLSLTGISGGFEDDEPFDIGWLDRYTVENRLVEGLLNNELPDGMYRLARASGVFPYGRAGEHSFNEIVKEARHVAECVRPFVHDIEKTSTDIDISVNGLNLTGTVEGIYGNRLIHYRPAGIKGKDLLSVWINHLALCAYSNADESRVSMISGFEMKSGKRVWRDYEITCPSDAHDILGYLVDCYFRGLSQAIHFFPETSLAFFDARDSESAIQKIRDKWIGTERMRGEGDDEYYQILFRGKDPFDDDFVSLAHNIYGPMDQHMVMVTL